MVISALGGITIPVAQSLVTRQVNPSEEGSVQGALAGLASLAVIAMPPLATWLFSVATQRGGPVYLPGIGFFVGAAVSLVATLAALGSLREAPSRFVVDNPPAGS